MKRVMIWIAASLMLLGIALFTVVLFLIDFDLTKVDKVQYQTNTYEFSAHDIENISLDITTADIEFRKSEDNNCRVVCYEQEKMPHDVSIQDNTLKIDKKDIRNWIDHITIFSFKTPTITIYLPEGHYHNLTVNSTTGDIRLIGGWSFDSMNVTTTTGDIYIHGVSCNGDVFTDVTTGETKLENMTCKNLTAEGTVGDAILSNVIVSDTLRAKRTTGDITLNQCDAGALNIKCTTGDVSGTLLTPKIIFATTSTGDIDIPKYTTGGRCEIDVTTGDICIKIG